MSPTAPPQPPQRVAVLALTLGGLVALTIVGASAVAVAVPDLAADLGMGPAAASWVMAAFSLPFAVATAAFGRAADRWGMRRPLWVGVALFAVGGGLAAAAVGPGTLIAARAVQGLGAGAVPVLATGIITTRLDGHQQRRALGVLGAVVSLVSASGPLIGGVLAEAVSWRAVLAVAVAAPLLALAVAALAPARRPGADRATLDWHGALLVVVAASAAMFAVQAPAAGLGAFGTAAGIAVLVLSLVAIAQHVVRNPDGFLPLQVVRNPRMLLVCLSAFTLLGAYLGALLGLPMRLRGELGLSALQIGLSLVPAAVVGAVVARVVGGRWAGHQRLWIAEILSLGSAVGLLLTAFSPVSALLFIPGMALITAAFAGGQVVLADSIPELVPEQARGVALGVFFLCFFLGGGVGTAIVGGLAEHTLLPATLATLALLPATGGLALWLARR